ncbi:MAG: immunoglobulin domain-containing protein, partial [Limisphaerales bacterium]
VACGPNGLYALRSDGTVMTTDQSMPTNLNGVVAISPSATHGAALRNDGTVITWRSTAGAATNVPPGLSNVVAISSGYGICLAVRSNGTVAAWGTTGSTNLPAGLTNVIAVSASQSSGGTSGTTVCTAVRADGSIALWGSPVFTPTNVVAVTSISNAVTVSAGYYNGLAIINDGTPQFLILPVGGTAYSGRDFVLKAQAVGAPVITYQWLHDGNVVTDATNATLTLTNIQLTDAGNYQVVVTNALGSATSLAAPLKVINSAPWFVQQPASRTVYVGSSVNMGAGLVVNGSGPMTFKWTFSRNGIVQTNIVTTNSDLVLNPVRVSDMGTYSVVVTNAFGVLATGSAYNLTVQQVVSWGYSSYGKTNIPPTLTNAIAVVAGNYYNSIALLDNGLAQPWGFNGTKILGAFTNLVEVGVGDGYYYFYGLRKDGTPTVMSSITSVPTGLTNALAHMSNIIQIEADDLGSAYLHPDGTVTRLDNNGNTVSLSIGSNVIALARLAAGNNGLAGLRADGSVFSTVSGLPVVTNALTLAPGMYGGAILKRDGSMVSWGFLTNPVASSIIDVATTDPIANFAVRSDGTITNWGNSSYPLLTNVPAGLSHVATLDGGENTCVALLTTNDFPPVFLPDALDTTALVVSSKNGAQWYGQTRITHDGKHAARSAAFSSNTASSMRMLATNGDVKVSFWWKVSSATNHDVLTFSIGGVPQTSISGEVDWQQVTFTVPAGPQMLVWTYSKDSATGAGQDAGFVDQLTFTPIPAAITLQPVSQTVVGGPITLFTASATGTAPLSYRWFKTTSGTALSTAPGLLRIAPANRSSSGTYYLIVTNAFGSDRSTNFTLTVHVPQRIGLPSLQPDGTFLMTSQDIDQTLFPIGADASGFQAQYSSNLIDWLPVTVPLSISNGLMQLNDLDSTNAPMRFYRVIENW